jgi:hypothetical protein
MLMASQCIAINSAYAAPSRPAARATPIPSYILRSSQARQLRTQLNALCDPQMVQALRAISKYCEPLANVRNAVDGFRSDIQGIFDRYASMNGMNLVERFGDQFEQCAMNDPVLQMLLGALTNVSNPGGGNPGGVAQNCAQNILQNALGALYQQVLGRVQGFQNCLTNALGFGQLQQIMANAFSLISNTMNFIQNFANTLNDRINNAANVCMPGNTAAQNFLKNCLNVGTGIKKIFDLFKEMMGIDPSPDQIWNEALQCIGEASGLIGPIQQIQGLVQLIMALFNTLQGSSNDLGNLGAGASSLPCNFPVRIETIERQCADFRLVRWQ